MSEQFFPFSDWFEYNSRRAMRQPDMEMMLPKRGLVVGCSIPELIRFLSNEISYIEDNLFLFALLRGLHREFFDHTSQSAFNFVDHEVRILSGGD